MKKIFCLLILLAFLMIGCAGVNITKVTKGDEEGIRYYRPTPYLLVSYQDVKQPDKEGDNAGKAGGNNPPAETDKGAKELKYTIVYLPDKSENYAISVRSGWGNVDTNFTIEEGWRLTQFGEKADSKTVEMINALTGALKEATQTAAGVAKQAKGVKGLKGEEKKERIELLPGLYRFDYDPEGRYIRGIVRVPISSP